MSHSIFIAGGTGYIGRSLIRRLVERNHSVRALVRPGSERKVPDGCDVVVGSATHFESYASLVQPARTFVHLVGVSHPSPAKAAEFHSIDLVSLKVSVKTALASQVRHFIYLSVAHPAPIMKEYVAARLEGEEAVRASGLDVTILRPWYVLGPGHRWPYLLLPFYWLAWFSPSGRVSARRLGLVTLPQIVDAIVHAVEHPPNGIREVNVPEIRLGRF